MELRISTKLNIFLLAILLLVMLFFLSRLYPNEMSITDDSGYYTMAAANISKNNGFVIDNQDKCGQGANLIPVVFYDPVFPYILSFVSKITNTAMDTAAKNLNYASWLIFFLCFACIGIKFFNKTNILSLVFITFLVFSSGLYTYNNALLTESVFLAFLGLLSLMLMYLLKENSIKKVLILSIIAGLFAVLMLLTRKAGVAFIIATFGILIWRITKEKSKTALFSFITFSSVFISTYLVWILYKLSISGEVFQSAADIYKREVHFNTFSRIITGINYFFTDAMAIPAALEKIAFLIVIPLTIIAIFVIFKTKASENKQNENNYFFQYIFFAGILYLASILYGSLSNPFNRDIGYMRFFYLIQPFFIIVLLHFAYVLIQHRKNNQNLLFTNINLIIIVLLLSLSLVSGINRNRILLKTVIVSDLNRKVEKVLQNIDNKENIFLSNHWAKVVSTSGKASIPIGYNEDISLIKTCYKKKYESIIIFLYKDIGKTYRIGAPQWTEILGNNKYEVIKETEKYILVKLQKETTKKEI